jgi:hypothetical protein
VHARVGECHISTNVARARRRFSLVHASALSEREIAIARIARARSDIDIYRDIEKNMHETMTSQTATKKNKTLCSLGHQQGA